MAALRRFLPRTIFARTLIMIVVPLVLLQVVVAFMFYGRLWEIVSRRLATGLVAHVAIVAHALENFPEDDERREWILDATMDAANLAIEFKPGAKLPPGERPEPSGTLERSLAGQLEGQVRRPFTLDAWGQPRLVVIVVELSDGLLTVRAPRERVYTSTSYTVFLWMAGLSLVFLVIAAIFLRNQVRPIRRLADAADAFGKGRDFEELTPAGATEVRRATAAFVAMSRRIRRFISQRTDMLSAASHDLRTPLTRMKMELELLPSHVQVDGLKTDIADMEQLIDRYLDFIRGEGEEQPASTEIARVLEETAEAARRSRLQVTLSNTVPGEAMLRPTAIKRCFDNIVSNAARHAKSLEISASVQGDQLTVLFDDDGPGIPDDKREEVFGAFVRLEASRNLHTGGLGLGLTLVRDVILSHGGSIQLEESPAGGLRVRVRLPM